MKEQKTIIIPKEKAKYIDRLLTVEPECEDECFGEDSTIVFSADFGLGYEVDVKVCGVQYEDGGCNLPWTEAVLFRYGAEVYCTEPSDELFGEWIVYSTDGTEFVVNIEREVQNENL